VASSRRTLILMAARTDPLRLQSIDALRRMQTTSSAATFQGLVTHPQDSRLVLHDAS
jgi:hypothetical protein